MVLFIQKSKIKKKCFKNKQNKLRRQKDEARNKKEKFIRYQYLVRNQNGIDKGLYYQCSECIERIFITREGIEKHYEEIHRKEIPEIDLVPL